MKTINDKYWLRFGTSLWLAAEPQAYCEGRSTVTPFVTADSYSVSVSTTLD